MVVFFVPNCHQLGGCRQGIIQEFHLNRVKVLVQQYDKISGIFANLLPLSPFLFSFTPQIL